MTNPTFRSPWQIAGLSALVLSILLLYASPPAGAADAGPGILPPPSSRATLPAAASEPSAADILPPLAETIITDPAPAAGISQQTLVDPGVVAPTPVDAVITPTPYWYEPAYWFGPDPWELLIELGLNGSEGNNNVLSMRAGGSLKRKTKSWKLDTSLQYNKNTANSIETQNDAKLDVRLDRVISDTRWTLFFLDSLIYDEFQAFDLLVSLDSGLGYKFIDAEFVELLGRFGAGATREFGGPDNDWAPQALFGLEYEHQLTPLQRLVAKVDYFPEWADFGNYRVVSDFGWEIDLDKPKNVSLKFSLVDRYDSTPNGVDPNNLDYAVLLIWGL